MTTKQVQMSDTTIKPYETEVERCLNLYRQKAGDYGPSWRVLRPASVTDQILIKAQRIRTLQEKGETKVGEGIEPEYIGIALYAAMGVVQLSLGSTITIDTPKEKAEELTINAFAKAKETMLKKNHDYGEAWRRLRMGSYPDLILQRLERMREMESRGGTVSVSEGLESNYIDLLNYAIFALILIKEGADPMKAWTV